jgi:hypothetical protein
MVESGKKWEFVSHFKPKIGKYKISTIGGGKKQGEKLHKTLCSSKTFRIFPAKIFGHECSTWNNFLDTKKFSA